MDSSNATPTRGMNYVDVSHHGKEKVAVSLDPPTPPQEEFIAMNLEGLLAEAMTKSRESERTWELNAFVNLDSALASELDKFIDVYLARPNFAEYGISLNSTLKPAQDLFFSRCSILKIEEFFDANDDEGQIAFSNFHSMFYFVARFKESMAHGKGSSKAIIVRQDRATQIHAAYFSEVFSRSRWQCCKCGNRNKEGLERCEGRGCGRHRRCGECIPL